MVQSVERIGGLQGFSRTNGWSKAMTRTTRSTPNYVIGPDGGPLTLMDLPAADTRRWVARRKAQVVAAVHGGLLSLEDACARYALTTEEFLSWERAIHDFGLAGLRATHMQEYRHTGDGALLDWLAALGYIPPDSEGWPS
jgi:hypothetical protein